MRRSRSKSLPLHTGLWLACSILSLVSASASLGEVEGAGQSDAPPGEELLRRAFDNLYDCDMRTLLELVLRDKRGEESVRRAHVARKRIGGRMHGYGRFLDPPWMRGTALLVIDNRDRSDDHFLFLPDARKIRRVTSVQGTDAFLGSDLSYEDLERRHPEDYRVESVREDSLRGEPVFVVAASPVNESGYRRAEFAIAKADHLLLATSFFNADATKPFKTIEITSRDEVSHQGGHLIPTRLLISDRLRGTSTEARFEQLEIDPEIDDSLFSSAALESGREIPGLTR